jgi:hypothetical protein
LIFLNPTGIVTIGEKFNMSESLGQKYDKILSLCEIGKQHGAFTQISCPCTGAHKHGDKEKSASLGLHSNGISFKCFAGCQTDDFLKVLGLTYKDLFPDNEDSPSNIYTYHNPDGTYHHDKVKYKLPNGKKTFKQRTIDESGKIVYTAQGGIPFRYPQLIDGIKQDKLCLFVEGEKDALTGELLGYVSTTLGGASDWKDEYKNFFKGAKVILIPDKDDPGLKHANNVAESLKTVCKSLKIVILPVGKDLTEWVEAGNSDLQTLIDKNSVELITTKGVPEPITREICGGYELYWFGMDLKVTVDHVQDDDLVELAIYEKDKPVYISSYRLLSVSHKESLIRALGNINKKLDWFTITNQITIECLSRIRNGEQVVMLDSKIGAVKPEFLVFPIMVSNNVNIIYADRSSAKSLFIMWISLLLNLGWVDSAGLKIYKEHKVLWLDWENDSSTSGWSKECLVRGLGIEGIEIAYLHMTHTLAKSIPYLQQKINEVGADTIVIDSLGIAVGGDLNLSEPAIEFFNSIRKLPVTPVVIAHTAKDKNNPRKTVYGSAFYENLARSVWEASKKQEYGAHELVFSLFQRKAPPFAGYHEPLGFRFMFEGDITKVSECEPMPDERDNKGDK